MTIETMRRHESVNLHYDQDFRRRSLVQLTLPHVIGPRVLDMRCLTGSLAVELALAGMDVTALGGHEQSVARTNAFARSRGITRPIAQVWDLTRLTQQVGVNRFDSVVCLDVLNHVRDDEEAMAEIAQVLVDGGQLIVAAPAFPGLLGKRDRSLGHLRRYTKAGLKMLLERHGFSVTTIRFWNITAFPLYALVERGLKSRISDEFRYGWWGRVGSLPNRVLTAWYAVVENHIAPPFGLTLFAIARKCDRSF